MDVTAVAGDCIRKVVLPLVRCEESARESFSERVIFSSLRLGS